MSEPVNASNLLIIDPHWSYWFYLFAMCFNYLLSNDLTQNLAEQLKTTNTNLTGFLRVRPVGVAERSGSGSLELPPSEDSAAGRSTSKLTHTFAGSPHWRAGCQLGFSVPSHVGFSRGCSQHPLLLQPPSPEQVIQEPRVWTGRWGVLGAFLEALPWHCGFKIYLYKRE